MNKFTDFFKNIIPGGDSADSTPVVTPPTPAAPVADAPDAPDAPVEPVTPAPAPAPKKSPLDDDLFTVDTSSEDTPKDEPADTPADEPKDEPKDDAPADEPKDEPKDEPEDTPADAPADEPKDVTDTDPVDVPAEPQKPVDLDKPERRVVTSVADESGYVVGFSIQGRSHISNGTPCEDYHAYKELAPGWKLFITSDGAGSARESARGSKANCEMAEKFITQLLATKGWVEKNYMPTELEWYIECYNIFLSMKAIIFRQAEKQAAQYKESKEAALKELEAKIEQTLDLVVRGKLESHKRDLIADINRPLSARDFNATIILMLLTPNGMLTAHIGDGRMGYKSKDGEWKALLTPHKGDEASSTVFIPNDWNQVRVPAFTMSDAFLPDVRVVHELPEVVVLMSDGCENITWSCYSRDDNGHYYDPNKPFTGFFEPLLEEMNADLTPEARVDRLIEIINVGTTAGRSEHDDRTMLFGVFK
ncbi:MAG: protein phosphatase 2C domain-containing protein [Alistipes sp.]|nr:protein phosphatase 2C domain-containing protein [Alistipes sp.]